MIRREHILTVVSLSATLMSAGLPPIWANIFFWLGLLGLACAAVMTAWDTGPIRAARRRFLPSTFLPQRVPIADVVHEAVRRGLDSTGDDAVKFSDDLRQAVVDGEIRLFGRLIPSSGVRGILDSFPLVVVPPEHAATHWLNILMPAAHRRNEDTETYIPGASIGGTRYVDLHVEKSAALRWMKSWLKSRY